MNKLTKKQEAQARKESDEFAGVAGGLLFELTAVKEHLEHLLHMAREVGQEEWGCENWLNDSPDSLERLTEHLTSLREILDRSGFTRF